MISLGVTLDYSFSSPSGLADPKDLIYIDYIGGKPFPAEERPFLQYPNLDTVLELEGDVTRLFTRVTESGRQLTAFLDEVDVNRLVMHFLRGMFPNITREKAHLVLRLLITDQKYSQINRSTKVKVNRSGKLGLKLPTPMQSGIWYDEAADQKEFPVSVKENASIEYLLANARAVKYDETDHYVQVFRSRLNDLLWDMLVDDYSKRRRKLILGVFGIKENLGVGIDPMSDNIDQQIETMDQALGFDGSIAEKTPSNALKMHRSIQEINERNDIHESFKEMIAGFFLDDNEITHAEFVELLESDRRRPWSALFGRNKMLRGTGSLFLSLHQAVRTLRVSYWTLTKDLTMLHLIDDIRADFAFWYNTEATH